MATAKKSSAKKVGGKKSAARKSAAKTASHKAAHKKSAKKSAQKSTKPAEQTSRCWPGFKPVPGKDPGEKGSCEPKAKQTPAEKKADARAAAASKRK